MGVFSFFEGEEFWLIYNVVSPFFPSKKWKEGKEKNQGQFLSPNDETDSGHIFEGSIPLRPIFRIK